MNLQQVIIAARYIIAFGHLGNILYDPGKLSQKAKNGIWVLVSKKNPNYWDEFKKQLTQK